MTVYKIECVDVPRAIVVTLRITGMGCGAIRLGKAVLTDAAMTHNVPKVLLDAVAFTSEPTEHDMTFWSEK